MSIIVSNVDMYQYVYMYYIDIFAHWRQGFGMGHETILEIMI